MPRSLRVGGSSGRQRYSEFALLLLQYQRYEILPQFAGCALFLLQVYRYTDGMTYAHMGSLVAQPGKRDAVVEILTRLRPELRDAGCLLYEVGTKDGEPDSVYAMELWESAEAHQGSLQLPDVKAAIDEVVPMLTGQFESQDFNVVGSPLRSTEA